jgi:fucose permease
MKPASQYTDYIITLFASCVVFLSAFYLDDYLLAMMPAAIISELAQEFQFSLGGMASLIPSYFYAYVLMQSPARLICDKIGPKRCLIISAAVCALNTLVFISLISH